MKAFQNLTIEPEVAKGFYFVSFWMTFGIPFSINFPDRLNLLICNKHNVETSFFPYHASHFGIKNQLEKSCFSYPFLGLHFSHCSLKRIKQKRSVLEPLQNPMGSKTAPKIRQVAPKLRKSRSPDVPKTRS